MGRLLPDSSAEEGFPLTEATQVAPEVNRGRKQVAAIVVAGHATQHVYMSALQSILLPEIKISLGLSATQLGTLAFSRQLTGWTTTMATGYLGDRFVNRAALILAFSVATLGVAYFIAGSASSYWVIFAAMLLAGIGPSMFHPAAIGALSRRFPERRGFAIALHGTGGSVGEAIGPIIAAGALTILMWQNVLRVSLFPALLIAFVIWGAMRNVPGQVSGIDSSRAYFASLASLLRKRALLVLVLVTALRSMGHSAIMIFLPVYLREDLAFSPTRVAIYLSMAQIIGIGSQPLMGSLSDRLGRKIVLIPAMTCLGLLFFALRYADPGAQLVLTILAMGAFLYSLHTIFIAAGMDISRGEVQSTVASLIYGAAFLGNLSPIFAGMIADRYGIPNAFLYAGALVLLATAVLARLKLPKTTSQMAQDGPQST